ncbi:hypothetical protein [Psychrobacillus antarcticus]|uniref:hypothetical protein n=1 Tax=Psychrobacillus antarcticus TaxID=2879115 RepID=UPI002407A3F4|nr:hypothetical protein [Psychrobacillus antarcticus]
MVYKLVTQKSPMFMVLIFGVSLFFISIGESWINSILSILLIIFSIISFSTKSEFIINQDKLDYVIRSYHYKVFHKKLFPDDIDKIVFKRYGWATKGASLKVHKGLNLRIVQFIPKDVMLQLETFAVNNNISINKSKDYLLLERREKY